MAEETKIWWPHISAKYFFNHDYWFTYGISAKYFFNHDYWFTYGISAKYFFNHDYWFTYGISAKYFFNHDYWFTYGISAKYFFNHDYWFSFSNSSWEGRVSIVELFCISVTAMFLTLSPLSQMEKRVIQLICDPIPVSSGLPIRSTSDPFICL